MDFSKASDRGGEALYAAMRRGRLHILESIKKRHPKAVGKLNYWTALEKERRGTMRYKDPSDSASSKGEGRGPKAELEGP